MKEDSDWYEQSKLVGRFRKLSTNDKQFTYELRDHMTPAEIKLWKAINKKQLNGFHFRKQHKIGPYCVDFYCHAARLVIEVDGPIHLTRQDYDAKRTEWLNSIGLRVFRFKNELVLSDIEQVKTQIIVLLKEQTQKDSIE